MTNTLHISAGGDIGGIETLFRSVADSINNSSLTFCFFSDGITSKYIKEHTKCRTIVVNNHRFDKQAIFSATRFQAAFHYSTNFLPPIPSPVGEG